MSATTRDDRLAAAIEQVKRVCAAPPDNGLHGIRRRRFEQSYILRQEDALHSIFSRWASDEPAILELAEVAEEAMRKGEVKRFRAQSAFDASWRASAHRSPGKARNQIQADIKLLHTRRTAFISDLRSALARGERLDIAHRALNLANLSAGIGIRQAALAELEGKTTTRARQ